MDRFCTLNNLQFFLVSLQALKSLKIVGCCQFLRSSLMWVLRSVVWYLLSDVSGQLISLIFKGQAVPGNWTYRISRIVGKQLQTDDA